MGTSNLWTKIISFVLTTSILLSLLPVSVLAANIDDAMPNYLKSSDMEESDTDSLSPPEVESQERDYDELVQLDGIQFSEDGTPVAVKGNAGLSTSEIGTLLGVKGKLLSASLYARDSLTETQDYSYFIDNYGLSEDEVDQGAKLHLSMNQLTSELMTLSNMRTDSNMTSDTLRDCARLICSGYTCTQAMAAYVAGGLLNLPTERLCQVRADEISANLAQEAADDKAPEQEYDDTLLACSIRYGLPYDMVSTFQDSEMDALDRSFLTRWHEVFPVKTDTSIYSLSDTLEASPDGRRSDIYTLEKTVGDYPLGDMQAFTASNSSTQTYAPESILEKPFRYDQIDNVDVNLNTGSVFYRETDLTIPGINGLDLKFSRIFDSNSSWSALPKGFTDPGYEDKDVLEVSYRCYLWNNYYDGDRDNPDLSIIPDISKYTFMDSELNIVATSTISFTGSQYEDAVSLKDRLNKEGYTMAAATDQNGERCVIQMEAIVAPLSQFTEAFYNVPFTYDYLMDEYGIGQGWRLGFSAVETYFAGFDEGNKQRLITSDGRRYEILFTSAAGDSNLVDYPLTDIRLENTGNGYPGASYTLFHVDGKKEYYDADGRNIAIVDRFGNTITLSYTMEANDPDAVSEILITDTLGNHLVYKNEHVDSAVTQIVPEYTQKTLQYNVLWTLSLNGSVVQKYYAYKFPAYQFLICVVNENGEATRYNSFSSKRQFNCYISTAATNDSTATQVYLSSITFPNGNVVGIAANTGAQSGHRLGSSGYCEDFSTASIHYSNPTSSDRPYTNRRTYKYSDYSNLNTPYADNYLYSTVTTDYQCKTLDKKYLWQTQCTTFTFDSEHRNVQTTTEQYDPVQDREINSEADFDRLAGGPPAGIWNTVTYQYNDNNLPISILTKYFDPGASSSGMQKIQLFTYDEKGNVLTETKPNGVVYTYTYSPDYNIPTSETHLQDAATTITTTNTLTEDAKSVAATVITRNGTVEEQSAYTYDGAGRMAGEKTYSDASHYSDTTYSYGTGALPSEKAVTNVKDADGSLVPGSPGYPAGTIVQKTSYNTRGWPTSYMDGNGAVTQLEYDPAGRITKVTNPDGTTASYSYSVADNLVTVTNELGSRLQYQYDRLGGLILKRDPDTDQTLYTASYDSMNRLAFEWDHTASGNDRYTYYSYDVFGRVTERCIKNASGAVLYQENYQYLDGSGKTVKTIAGDASAPSVITTSYQDTMGNVVKTGRMIDGTELADTFTYDYTGNRIQSKTAYTASIGGAFTTSTTYDHRGLPLSVTNTMNQTVNYGYDWLGQKISTTDPSGNTSFQSYDALGRVVKESKPMIGGTTPTYSEKLYTYDPQGNLIKTRTANQLPGQPASYSTVEYAYNNRDILTMTKQSNESTSYYTQYWHDAMGNVLRMYTGLSSPLTISGLDEVTGSDPNYSVTRYSYDRYGNPATTTDPLGQTEYYTYDPKGLLLSKVDRKGNTTLYTYDPMSRLLRTEVQNPGGTVLDFAAYTYTQTGQKASESNASVSTQFQYDALGRLTLQSSGTVTQSYGYNSADLRTGYQVVVSGAVQLNGTYSYDAMGRLYQVSGNGVSATYGYDANGNQSFVSYGNGLREEFSYNAGNLVTTVSNKNGTSLLSQYNYTYLLDGNQATKTDQLGCTTGYRYNDLGQLTNETESQGGTLLNSYTYQYDDWGNRTQLNYSGQTDTYTVSYAYDTNNRLQSESKTTALGQNKTSYFYDPNGNQYAKVNESITTGTSPEEYVLISGVASSELNDYNGFNQLVETGVSDKTVRYTYNPSGLRVSKDVDGAETQYILDGGNVVAEQSSGVVTAQYIRGINLIASTINGAASYYLYNAHGDVTQLTDAWGNVTKNYEYDAFGNEKNIDSNDTNPFRYCGEYLDLSSGTYYLRARYYDPTIGRFLSEDTHWNTSNMICGDDPLMLNKYTKAPDIAAIRQSGNLYVYAMNNPLSFIDPSGETTFALGGEAAAAFLLKLGVSGQLVIDDKGNFGVILAGSGGGGTPSAGISGTFTMTNADTIFDLSGVGFATGGSAAFGLPVSLGIDVIGGTAQDGTAVVGGQIAVGVSTPWPEGHGELSCTGVISLNWLPKWMKNGISNLINGAYDTLSPEQQDAIWGVVGG